MGQWTSFLCVLFHIIQLHERKCMYLGIALLCIAHNNVGHGLIFIIIIVGISSSSRVLRIMLLDFAYILIAILIIGKMLFTTHIFYSFHSEPSCQNGILPNKTSAEWFGFSKNKLNSFEGYFAILATSVFFKAATLKYRFLKGVRRKSPKLPLFPGITRKEADQSIPSALKYLINYGYYKFGVEFCQIAFAAMTIWKDNVYTLLYGFFLLFSLCIPRNILGKCWMFFVAILAVATVFQYIMTLGIYPGICSDFDYGLDMIVQEYFFIDDVNFTPNSKALIGDVLVLMLMRQQMVVFSVEKSFDLPAGSNRPEYKYYHSKNYRNPVRDHTILYKQSSLDHLKTFIFGNMPWVSLFLCFIIGTSQSDVLSLCYLIAAFVISTKGIDAYLLHIHNFVHRAITLVIFCGISITYKSIMYPLHCYLLKWNAGLMWTIVTLTGAHCDSPRKTFLWELGNFTISLFMIRYYKSHYFLHHVNDIRAKKIVETGGAFLIHKLRRDKLLAEKEERNKALEKIIEDMALIKAYNKEVQGQKNEEPNTHDEAVMQGDYYMFENLNEIYKGLLRFPPQAKKKKLITDASCETSARPSFLFESERASKDTFWEPLDFETKAKLGLIAKFMLWYEFLKTASLSMVLELTYLLNKLSVNERFLIWSLKMERMALKDRGYMDMESVFSVNIPTLDDFYSAENEATDDTSPIVQLCNAIIFVLMANTELVCYFTVFLHQLLYPSLLSLLQPLMVLMWGSLSPDRPTPAFWILLIAYNEATLVVKTLFQNAIFPWLWSHKEHDMFYAPYIIGIAGEETDAVAHISVFLLIIFLVHREKLKSIGLWTDDRSHNPKISESSINLLDNEQPSVMESVREHIKPLKKCALIYTEDQVRLPKDVYPYIFLLEFIQLVVIVIGFASFTSHSKPEKIYIAENEVPPLFLAVLIIQFLVIIIDRVLYLKKNLMGKFFFHISLVLLSHLWLFAILPTSTGKPFKQLLWPQVWYTLKFLSFVLSAYQLRAGYPLRVQQHFLCHSFGKVNSILYSLLSMIPFFMPLRTVVTWLSVKTSLTYCEFTLFEAMYSVVFSAKCSRVNTEKVPSPRGVPYPGWDKWPEGVFFLGGMCAAIWAPLIIFAIFNKLASSEPPTDADFHIRVKPITELFSYHIESDNIKRLSSEQFRQLQATFKGKRKAEEYLQDYNAQDIFNITFNQVSMKTWEITPTTKRKFMESLRHDSLTIEIIWRVTRAHAPLSNGASTDYEILLDPYLAEGFLSALQNDEGNVSLHMPRYYEYSKDEHIKGITLSETNGYPDELDLTTFKIFLETENGITWWEVHGDCQKEDIATCQQQIHILVFAERKLTTIISFLPSNLSIIGLYGGIIFFIGTMIRKLISTMYHDVKYRFLPNVDAVFQLCQDIQVARESEEFSLEEDLYAKLLFLFRSPESMIKWSRYRNVPAIENIER